MITVTSASNVGWSHQKKKVLVRKENPNMVRLADASGLHISMPRLGKRERCVDVLVGNDDLTKMFSTWLAAEKHSSSDCISDLINAAEGAIADCRKDPRGTKGNYSHLADVLELMLRVFLSQQQDLVKVDECARSISQAEDSVEDGLDALSVARSKLAKLLRSMHVPPGKSHRLQRPSCTSVDVPIPPEVAKPQRPKSAKKKKASPGKRSKKPFSTEVPDELRKVMNALSTNARNQLQRSLQKSAGAVDAIPPTDLYLVELGKTRLGKVNGVGRILVAKVGLQIGRELGSGQYTRWLKGSD